MDNKKNLNEIKKDHEIIYIDDINDCKNLGIEILNVHDENGNFLCAVSIDEAKEIFKQQDKINKDFIKMRYENKMKSFRH